MSRGVASRGCVVWASAVGVAPCGPSLVGVVWARPVLYCIVLGGPGTRGLARGAARALLSGVNNVMLCYVDPVLRRPPAVSSLILSVPLGRRAPSSNCTHSVSAPQCSWRPRARCAPLPRGGGRPQRKRTRRDAAPARTARRVGQGAEWSASAAARYGVRLSDVSDGCAVHVLERCCAR